MIFSALLRRLFAFAAPPPPAVPRVPESDIVAIRRALRSGRYHPEDVLSLFDNETGLPFADAEFVATRCSWTVQSGRWIPTMPEELVIEGTRYRIGQHHWFPVGKHFLFLVELTPYDGYFQEWETATTVAVMLWAPRNGGLAHLGFHPAATTVNDLYPAHDRVW